MATPFIRPKVTAINRDGVPGYSPVFDLDQINVNRRSQFKLPVLIAHLDVSADLLFEIFLSDTFIDSVVLHTNKYIDNRNLLLVRRFRNVSKSEIYQFFAILMYLGVVQLANMIYGCPT